MCCDGISDLGWLLGRTGFGLQKQAPVNGQVTNGCSLLLVGAPEPKNQNRSPETQSFAFAVRYP